MQAAEANSPAPAQASSPSWGSLVALPSPQSGPMPQPIEEALAFARRQQDTLSQLADGLGYLAHLADQSQQAETTDPDRLELHRSFHQRFRTLNVLLDESVDAKPLFRRKDWTIDLEPPGNKLVLPGIYRSAEKALSLEQTDLLSPASARETHQRILEVLEWLAIDQALLTNIRTRLAFAGTVGRINTH